MGLGYALTEDFPADPTTGCPTNMTLRSLGILRPKDVPADRRRSSSSRPQPERAVRHQGRGRDRPRAHRRRGGRRPARPRRRVAHHAADARQVAADPRDPGRAPSVTRRSGLSADVTTPGWSAATTTSTRRWPGACRRRRGSRRDFRRDPRAGLVAARRRPRPRDAPLVGRCSARSRRSSAARPRSSTTTRARTPSRAASTSSPTPAPRSACGWSCAYGVTDRHGADGARARAWPRTSGSCAPAAAGMVGVHAAFTCADEHARRGRRAGRRPRRRRAHPRRRGPIDVDAGARLAALAADDWLLVHCVHLDRDLPGTIAHNPRSNMNNARRLRPPGAPAEPGRARHRRHRRRHARGVPARLRRATARTTCIAAPDTAWGWLESGWDLVPEAARRPGHVELRPRRSSRGTSPSPRRARPRRGRASTARSLLRDGQPTRVDAAEVRAKAAEQAARLFATSADAT